MSTPAELASMVSYMTFALSARRKQKMNQLELNKQVAAAYGVDAERDILDYFYSEYDDIGIKTIPLHEDTLSLFRLCIEHGLFIRLNEHSALIIYSDRINLESFYFKEYYENHPTKELATCAAMFAALAKLKGIE